MLLKLITKQDHWQLHDLKGYINKSSLGKNTRYFSALCFFFCSKCICF